MSLSQSALHPSLTRVREEGDSHNLPPRSCRLMPRNFSQRLYWVVRTRRRSLNKRSQVPVNLFRMRNLTELIKVKASMRPFRMGSSTSLQGELTKFSTSYCQRYLICCLVTT